MEESLATHSVVQRRREGDRVDLVSWISFLSANTIKKSKVNYIPKVADTNLLPNIQKSTDEIYIASSLIIESLLSR